jgi:hypothetical protein
MSESAAERRVELGNVTHHLHRLSRFSWYNLSLDLVGIIFCALQVVTVLQIQPELRRSVEVTSQSEGGIDSNSTFLSDNVIDSRGGNTQSNRQSVCAHIQRNEKFLSKDLSRVNGPHFIHRLYLLVVIGYLYITRAIRPTKADAPLLIDSDAVLTKAIPSQSLKVITWRRAKVEQLNSGIEDFQFAFSLSFKCSELLWVTTFEKLFGVFAFNALDHGHHSITQRVERQTLF